MKKTILLCVLLLSISAFADQNNVVKFKQKSALPVKLQTLINQAVVEKCDYIVRAGWEVSEATTTKDVVGLDTLVTDLNYRTLLAVDGWDSDGYHPMRLNIVVESVARKVFTYNPEYSVLALDGGDYCKRN